MSDTQNYQDVLYERIGPIARIWHNRPERRNAEGKRLLDELDHAFQTAEADPSVRVVILGGKGPHFSSGHDLKDAQRDRPNPTIQERWQYEEKRFFQYCQRIMEFTKPTIAQVQGGCIAGGFMVANMCDLIVASDDAFFADSVTHSFGVASLEVLIHPWVLGMRKAKEFLFTGRRMSAAEAREAGMVNHVYPLADLEGETLKLAERIAESSPFSMMLLKRSLLRTQDAQGLRIALNAHFDTHQLSHATDEFKEKTAGGYETRIGATKGVIQTGG